LDIRRSDTDLCWRGYRVPLSRVPACEESARVRTCGLELPDPGISAACEGYSLRVAYREFRQSTHDNDDLWPAILLSKDPSVFAVIFEDSAALLGLAIAAIGLALSQILGIPMFDAIASMCIGLILIVASTLLANETRHLLIGEGARTSTLKRICELVRGDPAVQAARRPLTMYLGPETVLLALDIQFQPNLSAREVTLAVDRLEEEIRKRYPKIRHIYLEAESIGAKALQLNERSSLGDELCVSSEVADESTRVVLTRTTFSIGETPLQ